MPPDAEPFLGLLDEYLTFLQHHRGVRDATLYFHRRWGRQFLQHLAKVLPQADLAHLSVSIVDDFVLPLARKVGRGTQSQVTQAVRGLLRHLHRTGRVREDWSRFVQGPALQPRVAPDHDCTGRRSPTAERRRPPLGGGPP